MTINPLNWLCRALASSDNTATTRADAVDGQNRVLGAQTQIQKPVVDVPAVGLEDRPVAQVTAKNGEHHVDQRNGNGQQRHGERH